jgi:hypothetical protein
VFLTNFRASPSSQVYAGVDSGVFKDMLQSDCIPALLTLGEIDRTSGQESCVDETCARGRPAPNETRELIELRFNTPH